MIRRPVEVADLSHLHALYSDPRVWEHFPTLRFTDPARTERMLRRWVDNWSHGLGQWTILTDEGEFIGHGGAQAEHDGLVWNVGYRIRPEFWGRGISGEVARAAVVAARQTAPDRPVIAYMLEHNVASWRTAQHAGLTRVWRGPDAGNPDPEAVRLVYADRALDDAVITQVVASA